MKTNANPKTIAKAVEIVSKTKYDRNVSFRKEPEMLTKNVVRFTLRVLDKNGKGAMMMDGKLQPKANQQVYFDVAQEIFRLEGKRGIWCDHTTFGRLNSEQVITDEGTITVAVPEETESSEHTETPTKKEKQPKAKKEAKQEPSRVLNAHELLDIAAWIAKHPEQYEKFVKEKQKLEHA